MSIRLHDERVERITNLVGALPSDCGIDKRLLVAKLKIATFDETNLLDDLFSLIDASTAKNVCEIFRGAHVLITDAGWYYRIWRRLGSAEERPSSHESDDDQYEIAGPCCHAVLFGILGNRTWFQMENHSYGDSMIGHGVDYVRYQKSSRNQGPYGSSAYTDKHPLWIQATTDDD